MAKSTMTLIKQKTLTAVALATAIAVPSVAAQAADNQPNEVCVDIASLAGNIMMERQNGTSKAQVQKMTQSDNEAYQALAGNIIADAYKEPRGKTDSVKNQQIDGFIKQYYNKCYNGVK